MEDKLKEVIKKNVKEEIAASNIRKEFDMKMSRNKRIISIVTSVAAVFILGLGFIITNPHEKMKNSEIKDLSFYKELSRQEGLKIDLKINEIDLLGASKLDADVKVINFDDLPEKIKFVENIAIPENFELTDMYAIYTKKDINVKEYNVLHDYVVYYQKDDEHNINISFSTIEEPLRDYYFGENNKISKIGDIEFEISKYKEMYLVTFKNKDIFFDIETNGITENELVELLLSIVTNKPIDNNFEDLDTNSTEPPKENVSSYPEYYSGKYIDNNGNNVILLCEDTENNRKEICNKFGITESKTIFKTAKYSYNYLTELQSKISKKMQNKEFTFITSSSLMEDSNNIKVIVNTENESEINKLKKLDKAGDAINIIYDDNVAKEDLLIEKE